MHDSGDSGDFATGDNDGGLDQSWHFGRRRTLRPGALWRYERPEKRGWTLVVLIIAFFVLAGWWAIRSNVQCTYVSGRGNREVYDCTRPAAPPQSQPPAYLYLREPR